MKLTPNMLRAYHRAPALRQPNANPTHPQVPLPEPIQQAPALDSAHAGEAQVPGLPIVRITHRRVRLLDAESKYAACKDLIDGLRYAGLLSDDREEDITLEVTQERVKHFRDEETVVIIEYPEP